MALVTKIYILSMLLLLLLSAACTRHEVEVKPVEVKPIHITIDVNVKVDRALDDFFGDLDEIDPD
ncbi:MAG: hypothetical protein ABR512_03525 [Desulfopila sp.]